MIFMIFKKTIDLLLNKNFEITIWSKKGEKCFKILSAQGFVGIQAGAAAGGARGKMPPMVFRKGKN